jgi:hypothetical protein
VILRQSVREHRSPFVYLGLLLLVPVALALIWYGLMLVALAFKVSPQDVNAISGYRDAYEFLAGLEAPDVTRMIRLITALAGLAAFLIFGFLAWKLIPRPYLARGELTLSEDRRGTSTLEPRAVERAVEIAAREHSSVGDARARYGDDGIEVDVDLARAQDVPDTLREVQRGVREALQRHDLPEVPVSVTLTGLDRQRRRELE